MKLKPIQQIIYRYDDGDYDLLECCDSVIAVLTQEQLTRWLDSFKTIGTDPEASDFCDSGTTTVVFDIDGEILVIVADSGGELASGMFEVWCEENDIECQAIVDSPDCTDVDVEDIYTGAYEDNQKLLGMLHRVYN